MDKSTKRVTVYHALFWAVVYACWVAFFRGYSFALSKTMSVEFCYLVFITADFYAINYFIIPRLFLRKRYLLFAGSVVTLIALSSGIRALIAGQLNLYVFHTLPWVGAGRLYVNSVLNITLWVTIFTAGKMLVDRERHQQQLESLEKERVENELDYLKAQINPHSLFNSLNTIYGHIDRSNQAARAILLQFSELLRYQLYDCGSDKVSLEKELLYIKNYVGFQRLRKDETLMVDVQVEHSGPPLKIAPLLLIVLVENAFKFVSSFPDRENRISIRLHTKGNILYGSICNTKESLQPMVTRNSNGIGLANLKRRLDLLYGPRYALTAEAGADYYRTDLTIDLT